jgi:hypothetical protein
LIRLILQPVTIMVISLLALSLTAGALGSTQPPNPALQGFVEGCEDKPQPCWYGIVPGITTAEETMHVLEEQGYRRVNQSEQSYTFSFNNDELFRVDFQVSCDNVQLAKCQSNPLSWIVLFTDFSGVTVGDILLTLGEPDSIGINPTRGPALFYPQLNIGLQDWVFPRHQIEGFELYISLQSVSRAAAWRGFARWHGAVRRWRYCQLERNLQDLVCD